MSLTNWRKERPRPQGSAMQFLGGTRQSFKPAKVLYQTFSVVCIVLTGLSRGDSTNSRAASWEYAKYPRVDRREQEFLPSEARCDNMASKIRSLEKEVKALDVQKSLPGNWVSSE